ncbi:MAG: synthase subunit b [Acidimicrobiaceae bacterium]|nr:synthase subunit b [Acidimicrobiaceae bacterium]
MLLAASQNLKLLPNWTFVAELLIFLVVLGLLGKFVLPPLQKAIRERDQTVRASLQAGDEYKAEAERLEAERQATLGTARQEARALLDEARKRAEEHRAEVRAAAEAERERIVSDAVSVLESEREAVRAEAMRDVGPLVAAAASQVLGAPVDAARHRDVIEAALRAGSASR